MTHAIVERLNGTFMSARLVGTPVFWHTLETEYSTFGGMWNATAGEISYSKETVGIVGTDIVIPDAYTVLASFADGRKSPTDRLVAKGYTWQDDTKAYDLLAAINTVHPCDAINVLGTGHTQTFSFDIGNFETADKSAHYSRFNVIRYADGMHADTFNLSLTRVVCKNTMIAALASGINMKARHTVMIDERVHGIVNPMIADKLAQAQLAQANYIETYNRLLELPAPNHDEFYTHLFGAYDPDVKRDTRTGKIARFENALQATIIQSPELANTAACYFNAATLAAKSAQTRTTKGQNANSVIAGKLLMQNDDVAELCVEFFTRAIETRALQVVVA